jgi:glycosyltransferase involved in cell wall biosynthesis
VPYFRAGRRTRVVRISDGVALPAESSALKPAAFGDPLRLCLIGGIDSRKGQDVAVTALAELHERGIVATLELVGRDVEEPFAASVREEARRLGVAGDVEFAGEVDDVDARLARADIVIAPSRDEWTPLVLMEALAHAKPVVATRVGAVADVVRDGESGLLVEPGSPAELASAIATLAADPAAATAMAERGRDFIRADFSLAGTLEGLQRELDRLVGPPPVREHGPLRAVV